MANLALEMVAMGLSLLGLIGASASTGMPMWKVTAFIGENIIVMETRWEGLWMNCYRQANIRMQCKVYDSLLYLPPDLQAARGLMCCSLALAGLGILLAITGMRCTSCIRGNSSAKRVMLIVAGSMILAACLCVLIPVSWTAHVIIQDFYNPLLINAQRRELGDALYIGWVSSAVLFAGGCIFTCCSISRDKDAPDERTYPRSGALLMYPPQVLQPHPLSYSYLSRQPSLQPSFHPAMQPPIHPAIQLSRHPSSVHSGMAYL
ncbi:claudin-4-like [Paramormyrops kingsleyae]|uniref:claudin-4-like n=1 Tax=Paramormyrops kingsleyae TaxID=1676925 RepID=UPI000CD5D9F8|nr:claudin-4-like [Paramormyrops kingsleyae]